MPRPTAGRDRAGSPPFRVEAAEDGLAVVHARVLARLLAEIPGARHALDPVSAAGAPGGTELPVRRDIVARLARALRAERQRGRCGHWTYDLNRHIALAQAYKAARASLAAAPSASNPAPAEAAGGRKKGRGENAATFGSKQP